MKKSIKIVGKRVEHAYVIRDIDVDKVTIEKYDAECRSDIVTAWGAEPSGQMTLPESNDQTFELILKDKTSNVTLATKPDVVEMLSKMGGKIVKDIKVEKTKKGKKAYLTGIEFFKEAVQE